MISLPFWLNMVFAISILASDVPEFSASLYSPPRGAHGTRCHIRLLCIKPGQDVYPDSFKREEKLARWFGRLTRIADINDQLKACLLLSAFIPHPSSFQTSFILFTVAALEKDELIHAAPATVGCQTLSALAAKAQARASAERYQR